MSTFEDVFAVVLAGGCGSRLWPKSRQSRPKQFQTFGREEKSLIEQTLLRLQKRVPRSQIVVVTHENDVELTRKTVGDLCGTVLGEPCSRNTAAAIALAASFIRTQPQYTPKTMMFSWHADHILSANSSFWQAHADAANSAARGKLTLLGVTPKRANTSYGYIEIGAKLPDIEAFQVGSFKEKPKLETARSYISKGGYLWNTGIFIWQIESFWQELSAHLPATARALENFSDYKKNYSDLESVSVDKAVLEKSKQVAVVEASIDWQDIGSYEAYEKVFDKDEQGNVVFGDVFLSDAKNNTLDVDRFTAVIGIEGVTIVSSENALLVCRTQDAQRVKEVAEQLRTRGREELY